jgi:hypothetical protein
MAEAIAPVNTTNSTATTTRIPTIAATTPIIEAGVLLAKQLGFSAIETSQVPNNTNTLSAGNATGPGPTKSDDSGHNNVGNPDATVDSPIDGGSLSWNTIGVAVAALVGLLAVVGTVLMIRLRGAKRDGEPVITTTRNGMCHMFSTFLPILDNMFTFSLKPDSEATTSGLNSIAISPEPLQSNVTPSIDTTASPTFTTDTDLHPPQYTSLANSTSTSVTFPQQSTRRGSFSVSLSTSVPFNVQNRFVLPQPPPKNGDGVHSGVSEATEENKGFESISETELPKGFQALDSSQNATVDFSKNQSEKTVGANVAVGVSDIAEVSQNPALRVYELNGQHPETWTAEDVGTWLESLGISRDIIQLFRGK